MSVFLFPIRKIGPIELEVTLSENHESTLSVTSNPVERGAAITDNATIEAKSVTIEAGFSSLPLGVGDTQGFDAARITNWFDVLTELQEERIPMEVQTGLKLYENMLVVSIAVTHDAANATVLRFTAQLKEIRIVDTLEVAVPAYKLASGATKDKATSDQSRGDVDAPNVDTAQPRPKSMLSSVFGGA